MKRRIKVFATLSVALASSNVQAVTGMDRLVFSPSFMFEEGNFAELTLARSTPSVSPEGTSDNVANEVDTARFAYKHQITDKIGLGFVISNQPIGVDVDYEDVDTAPVNVEDLRGQVSAKSYIALGHYKATENISLLGGVKYQTQQANADLSNINPLLPTPLVVGQDSDTGFIIGAAYSIPEIAFRASLTYESELDFDHDTNLQGVGNIGNTSSAVPKALTLELQSGIAKDTLLFGSIRRAEWDDAQIVLLDQDELSAFSDTTAFKIGIGRKFTDAISGSVTLNYEKRTGDDSSLFSPQDGEKGIAVAGRYLFRNGLATSLLVQYRELGDTTTSGVPISFEDSSVVTVGLRLSKSF